MLAAANISMITALQRKKIKNITSYSNSFLQYQKKMMSNDKSNTYNYPDGIYNSLDIADGLKELLIKYGFTLEVLTSMSSSELAEFLGIDKYIAQIICNAAKLSNDNYAPCDRSITLD